MKRHFFVYYILLVIAQILICEWFNLSAYVVLSILPALILCLPTKFKTTVVMIIAFATAFAVDFLAEGVMGLNIIALVPVAFLREHILRFFFGEELLVRGDSFSYRKNGTGKVISSVVVTEAMFLLVYIFADSFATRPILFNLIRFGASLLAGSIVSVFVVDVLTSEDRR